MAEIIEVKVQSDLGNFNKEIKDTNKSLEETEVAASKSRKGFKMLGTGVKAFGTALKAAGIGLIVAAFLALKEALGRNQKVMDAVNVVVTTVSTTFNQFVDVLVDTYKWVTQSSERFDALGKILNGIITIALTPLKLAFNGLKLGVLQAQLTWEDSFLGGGDEDTIKRLREDINETKDDIKEVATNAVEAGKNIVSNVGEAITEIGGIVTKVVEGTKEISIAANIESSKATIAAQNNAKLAEAALVGLIEKNDLLAETQRQIRDDETKSFEERITANTEIGKILDQQEKDMLALADTRVQAAAFELAQNKSNIELQVAYQQTLNDRAGVEAQIAGFRSEQLTNEVSLQKELLDVQNEVLASGLAGIDLELAELETAYQLKLEMARKAGIDDVAITKQYEKEKADITKSYLDIRKEAQMAFVSIMGQLTGKLSSLAKEGSNEAKALALVEIAVGTGVGFIQALDIAQKSAKAAGPGAAFAFPIFYASQVLSILGAVASAKQALGSAGGGGGGGGGVSAPSQGQAPAPQMMSGAFELGSGQAPEAVKAYVVTDEMTNSQNQLSNIRRRATI
jgi:hypothetical protein